MARLTPEKVVEALRECQARAPRRSLRVKCAVEGGVEYCLYTYKAADWRVFLEYPCLTLARGTVVVEGKHVVLPFTKFFNLGEVPGVDAKGLRGREPVRVYEKLDGTLVVVWIDPVTGELRGHTRGMLWMESPEGVAAESGVANPHVRAFMGYVEREGLGGRLWRLAEEGVVLFELVVPGLPASRSHTLGTVLEGLERARPYLLAVRRHGTMELEHPESFEWPLKPQALHGSLESLRLQVAEWEDKEGVVAWFPEPIYPEPIEMLDPLLKVKSPRYLLKVSGIGSRRGQIAHVLKGGLDDIRWQLSDEEARAFEEAYRIYQDLEERIKALHPYWQDLRALGLRGWLLEAVKDPDKTLGLVVENAPRKPEKLPRFLEHSLARLEKIAARLREGGGR